MEMELQLQYSTSKLHEFLVLWATEIQ